MISQTSFLEDGRLDQLDIDLGRKIQPSGGWLGIYIAKAFRSGYMSVQINEQGFLPDLKLIFKNKEMIPLSEGEISFLQKICKNEFFKKELTLIHIEGSTISLPYAKHLEDAIALHVSRLAHATPLVFIDLDAIRLDTTLSSLNPEQKQAILTLSSHTCSILTGGPGTGKTFTAGKWLQLLSQYSSSQLHVALIAPTGRAAQTLYSSISKATSSTPFTCDAQTIHRLIAQSSSFFPYNVIIVDECSMIDSSLFYQMLQKIYPGTRVLFLGDPNQIPPIDPGKPFLSLIQENLLGKASLITSHRTESKEILQLASSLLKNGLKTISTKETEPVYPNNLKNRNFSDTERSRFDSKKTGPLLDIGAVFSESKMVCSVKEKTDSLGYLGISIKNLSGKNLECIIEEKIISPWESIKRKEDALLLLQRCIILCPTRVGPLGTERINQFIHKRRKNASFSPIVFLKNNYDLGVMNGDLCVLEKSSPLEYIHSHTKIVLPATICPRYEEAFAMSIHKSQGSEFDCVILLLPPGADLDNKLLYTAVTRAKKELIICY